MDKALGLKLKIVSQVGTELKARISAEGAVLRMRLGEVQAKERNFSAILDNLSSARGAELPRLFTYMTSLAHERQGVAAMRAQLVQLTGKLQIEESKVEKLESKLASLKAVRENYKEGEELDDLAQLAVMQSNKYVDLITSKTELKSTNEQALQLSAVRAPEKAIEKSGDTAINAVSVDYRIGDKSAEILVREVSGAVAVEVGANSMQLKERFKKHQPVLEAMLQDAEVSIHNFKIKT